MSIKEIVDFYRSAPGYLGMAAFAGGQQYYSEQMSHLHASQLLVLLGESPGASRVSAVVNGVTLIAFTADGYTIALKLSGRFPPVLSYNPAETEFVDPVPVPGLPSRKDARSEAEAALGTFGLLP